MRSLAFLPAAEHDLDDIWAYIAEDNPFAADRVTDAILAACRRLLDQPLMGVARPELADDLRMTVSGSYLLFYVPLTDRIEIVRVLHGRRDLHADLF